MDTPKPREWWIETCIDAPDFAFMRAHEDLSRFDNSNVVRAIEYSSYATACGQRDEARTALTSQDKAYADVKCELIEARFEVERLQKRVEELSNDAFGRSWKKRGEIIEKQQTLLTETAAALALAAGCMESHISRAAGDVLAKIKSHMAGENK